MRPVVIPILHPITEIYVNDVVTDCETEKPKINNRKWTEENNRMLAYGVRETQRKTIQRGISSGKIE